MWHQSTYANCNVSNIGLKIYKLKSMMKLRKRNVLKQLYEKFVTQAKKKTSFEQSSISNI